jgi:preprotein translocase subunit YajC
MSDTLATFFAQVTNAAAAGADATAPPQPPPPWWGGPMLMVLLVLMFYFVLLRPQMQAKKKQEETLKSAKTGDKIVTTSGIHGIITNVKDSTVIVKVADNVKLEIEKSHIDKITRADTTGDPDKAKAPAGKT